MSDEAPQECLRLSQAELDALPTIGGLRCPVCSEMARFMVLESGRIACGHCNRTDFTPCRMSDGTTKWFVRRYPRGKDKCAVQAFVTPLDLVEY